MRSETLSFPVSRYNHSMPHTFEEIRQIVHELPEDQRILLAASLWESVEIDGTDVSEAEVDASWDAEIERRVAEIKAGTAITYSLQEVEADLRAIVGS
jgi:putative addiction module component (TIGR02574 family)